MKVDYACFIYPGQMGHNGDSIKHDYRQGLSGRLNLGLRNSHGKVQGQKMMIKRYGISVRSNCTYLLTKLKCHNHRFMVIIGGAGQGKTVAVRIVLL